MTRDAFTLQVRLADRLRRQRHDQRGHLPRARQADWEIDTWLMSCRVLGRKVESPCCRSLIAQARARGIERLLGHYLPTEKNRLVEDHYANLGFTRLDAQADGSTSWQLRIETAPVLRSPIRIRRVGFTPPVETSEPVEA